MATISGDFSTNLVAHWKMEETSGTREDIHSTKDLTAAGTGGVGSGTGIQGTAADLEEGDLDYLYVADNADFDFGANDFTISMWIKPESVQVGNGSDPRPIAKDSSSSGNYSWHALYYGNLMGFRSSSNGTSFTQTAISTTITAGNWYHMVWTRSGTTITCYLNGSSLGTGSCVATIRANSENLYIGSGNLGGSYIDGLIDEVSIWNGTALTSGNVTTIYNSGNGIPYEAAASGPTTLKSKNTVLKASIKTINGVALASIKSANTVV
jgi:hypothetical protein